MTTADWNGSSISRRTFVGGARRKNCQCPRADRGLKPKRGGILKVSTYLNRRLDPMTGNSAVDQTVMWSMFDTLVDFDQNRKRGRASPSGYPDPKTLVFELFPNITFHDGTPCDAAAVRVEPDFAVESVEVTGPLTVALHLKQPDSSIPLMMGDRPGMMSSPTAVQSLGEDYDRKPCGTGQFKFVSWADGDRVIVTRNENYWKKGFPYLDGITFRIMTDYSAEPARSRPARTTMFGAAAAHGFMQRDANGERGALPIDADHEHPLQPQPQVAKDVRVRKAINFAVDRVGFTRATEGTGDVVCSLIPPQHWANDPTYRIPTPMTPTRPGRC